MKTRVAHIVRAMAIVALVAFSAADIAIARAEATLIRFQLAAQSLDSALTQFAEQAKLQIFFLPATVQGLRSNSVEGDYVPAQALAALLRGTGLEFEYTGADSLTIRNRAVALPRIAQAGAQDSPRATALAPSGAEPSSAAAKTSALEEIIVTAQKRAQNTQDVPIAITAYTERTLDARGIDDARDLPLATPGLVISQVGSPQVALRGVSTSNLNITGDPGVGLYIDDIYIARASGAFQDFFDVSRIEILSGPQGTLFGRNSTGGVIHIVNREPENEFSFSAQATVGTANQRRFELATGGALLGEKLVARFAALHEERDGFATNRFDGEDVDDKDLTGARLSLRSAPNDQLTMTLRGEYTRDRGTGRPFKALTPGLAHVLGGTSPFESDRDVNINSPLLSERINKGASLRADLDLGSWHLTSISGLRVHETTELGDLDDTQISAAAFDNRGHSETLQQEFQITSSSIERLEWVAGTFLWWEDGDAYLAFPFPAFGITPINIPEVETFSLAVFAQGTYSLTDRLRVTTGLRFTDDDKDFRRDSSLLPIFSNVIETDKRKDSAWTPRFSVDYSLRDNLMLYGSVTKGFKSGGFNGAGRQPNYAPEHLLAYEAGLKSDWADNRLRLNLAAFYYDYEDVQALRIVQAGSAIDNAANGTIKGAEIQMTASPLSGLTASVSGAYLDARYDEYITDDPLTPGTLLIDVGGNHFARAPEWSGTLGIDYAAALATGGTLTLRGDMQYKSRYYFDQFNRTVNSQAGGEVFNARVTYETRDDKWRVSLFGRNLGDRAYTEARFEIAELGGTVLGVMAPPRTYGLEVGMNF